VLTAKFFAVLRTTDMGMETTDAKNTLPEQEAPRKSGRPSTTAMTSTTNLIKRLKRPRQRRIRDMKHTKWNPYHNKRNCGLITHEILIRRKNNLHCFTFSPNSEKPIKAAIRHPPPDTPVEDIFNSLENLGFNVINVRQMPAIRKLLNGQTHK
jgi:hypothetical protein